MELIQQQAQHQVLRPSLRRSLEVLQLPQAELETYLQEAVLSNPLLALEPDAGDVAGDGPLPDQLAQAEYDSGTSGPGERTDDWELPAAGTSRTGEFPVERLADPHTQGVSLADVLAEQLPPAPHLSVEIRRLCLYLIDCLDENGFLPFDLADLAREQRVGLSAMEQALRLLQGLRPAGVAARSLSECLTLQLARTPSCSPLALRLVQPDGLELLAKGNMTALAQLLGCSRTEARQAAAAVRGLHPRPAQGYGTGSGPGCQIPEAIFRREGDQVRIELNAHLARRLSLDEQSCALLRRTGSEQDRQYLREKKSEAQQLIRAVQARENTLVRLLRAVADCQPGYFLRREPLHPMTMARLAGQLGLSPSTVSRAVHGKWIQFEGRSIPLHRFFTPAIPAAGGAPVASEEVRCRILQLIRAEDPGQPLSDEALRAALAAEQLSVSRRTVTKYRKALGIPAAFARRRQQGKEI